MNTNVRVHIVLVLISGNSWNCFVHSKNIFISQKQNSFSHNKGNSEARLTDFFYISRWPGQVDAVRLGEARCE